MPTGTLPYCSAPDDAIDEDNCPSRYNPGQEDSDGDGIGDACEGAAIPTLNEWVMIILGLLILAVGTINIVRRRRAAMAR